MRRNSSMGSMSGDGSAGVKVRRRSVPVRLRRSHRSIFDPLLQPCPSEPITPALIARFDRTMR